MKSVNLTIFLLLILSTVWLYGFRDRFSITEIRGKPYELDRLTGKLRPFNELIKIKYDTLNQNDLDEFERKSRLSYDHYGFTFTSHNHTKDTIVDGTIQIKYTSNYSWDRKFNFKMRASPLSSAVGIIHLSKNDFDIKNNYGDINGSFDWNILKVGVKKPNE